jgi:peptidoglycan hydrolase-like protein with peptidoglycan-binding domain
VRGFQRSRHLNPSGIVGASTWNRLVVTLGRGSRGSAVRAVQHNLKFAYGFRFMRVTGFYGHETWLAVLAFQRGSRLPVDGIVGHRTWKTIIVFER